MFRKEDVVMIKPYFYKISIPRGESPGLNDDMTDFQGHVAIITDELNDNLYHLSIDSDKRNRIFWHKDWLQKFDGNGDEEDTLFDMYLKKEITESAYHRFKKG